MDENRPRILVLDDDEGCARSVRRGLERAGFAVETAASLSAARATLAGGAFSCIVTEFHLPDGPVVDLLCELRAASADVGRIVLTGSADYVALQDTVNRAGVHAFFAKPWDAAQLLQGVRGTLEQCRLARENRALIALLARHNAELAEQVAERTRQLERAKRELESVFDAWEQPLALVDSAHHVLRANLPYGRRAGLGVREVPGRACHLVRFDREDPCPDCPMIEARASRHPASANLDANTVVEARPLAVDRDGTVCLCRYVRTGEAR